MLVDNFTNETVLKPFAIMPGEMPKRKDLYQGEKRVELHLHTSMSNMDALTSTKDAIKQARKDFAEANPDGSYTIHFGGEDKEASNYLEIFPGWTYLLRLYLPQEPYFNGTWVHPELEYED